LDPTGHKTYACFRTLSTFLKFGEAALSLWAEHAPYLLLDAEGSWNVRFQPLSELNLSSAESGTPGVQPKMWVTISPLGEDCSFVGISGVQLEMWDKPSSGGEDKAGLFRA
jgi:hypothetical protein